MIAPHPTLPFQEASEPGMGFDILGYLVHLVSEPHTPPWEGKQQLAWVPESNLS